MDNMVREPSNWLWLEQRVQMVASFLRDPQISVVTTIPHADKQCWLGPHAFRNLKNPKYLKSNSMIKVGQGMAILFLFKGEHENIVVSPVRTQYIEGKLV